MSSLDRLYIEPTKLRDWWEWVRPKLLETQHASTDKWIPEDIYHECMVGRAMLWVMLDDKPRGFGILIPRGDTLHIWCGYGAFLMDEGFRHAREIAKSGGASKISFESLRPGWQKVAAKYGFKPIKFISEV